MAPSKNGASSPPQTESRKCITYATRLTSDNFHPYNLQPRFVVYGPMYLPS